MAEVGESFKFKHPSSILIAGPSGCGKTVFTTKLITENRDLWSNCPNVVYYCYGAWQDSFLPLKKKGVHFHSGIPEESTLSKWFPKGGLLILDDLMEEGGNDKRVLDLFTKLSHHKGITVLYLTQDLFPPGKFTKTISRNAHYMVAFKNPRDNVGLRTLLLQVFLKKWKDVQKVFNRAMSRPFSYLLLDFHPASSDSCRILSHVLSHEGYTHCYF